ncbi:MAG: adenylate/guanylate cyclase domain-containing protein [Chloroflexota bacterium]|nr:adenylate/guanylate cyclase domain-containing protein [Chloroflexota bacterium]
MTSHKPSDERTEEEWREYLSHPDSMHTFGRHVFARIPSHPRCQLCAAPFAGVGGPLMRLVGKRQSRSSPNMCNSCERELVKRRGGAEVDGSLLFADIRGSTTLAERVTPGEFKALLGRFYTTATECVVERGGIVDKFVGDELVAVFPPFLGERHAERAVAAAQALLRATGHGNPEGPWVPLGAGVHTGRVWFGAIGDGGHLEITVVGDVVNTTARLAARAAAGEILVSSDAATAAGLDVTLERTSLELKGKQRATDVVTLRVGHP